MKIETTTYKCDPMPDKPLTIGVNPRFTSDDGEISVETITAEGKPTQSRQVRRAIARAARKVHISKTKKLAAEARVPGGSAAFHSPKDLPKLKAWIERKKKR